MNIIKFERYFFKKKLEIFFITMAFGLETFHSWNIIKFKIWLVQTCVMRFNSNVYIISGLTNSEEEEANSV